MKRSTALLALLFLALSACTSADKKACQEAKDKAGWQACNRECTRGDNESCAKAKLLEAQGKNK